MTVEIFANNPSTTVTSGGSTTPAAGSQETWTVASSDTFPAASSATTPPTQFHIADPAQPAEIMAVVNVSGTTWTVVRGAESTDPVAHAANFAVEQVVTAGALEGFVQSASEPVSPDITAGTATLDGTDGTVSVSLTSVTSDSVIILSLMTPGSGTVSYQYWVSATTPGEGFTISSSQATDNSTIAYVVIG